MQLCVLQKDFTTFGCSSVCHHRIRVCGFTRTLTRFDYECKIITGHHVFTMRAGKIILKVKLHRFCQLPVVVGGEEENSDLESRSINQMRSSEDSLSFVGLEC